MNPTSNIKNIESPFTELFSLLKRCEESSVGLRTLAYNSDELIVIHQHIDNAVDVLLQGLQDLGQLMGLSRQKNVANSIGFFISAISNLTEALNSLRLDTNYILKQRGATDF